MKRTAKEQADFRAQRPVLAAMKALMREWRSEASKVRKMDPDPESPEGVRADVLESAANELEYAIFRWE